MFNDTHLTRLRLITSMLDRGYNIAHVREMLSAWEEGKNLGDVLGLETAIVGTWTTEKPETIPLVDAERLVDDPRAFDRLVALQVIRVDGARATITRPKLIEAFNEIRGYGVELAKLIDLHEQIVPEIDKISDLLVRAGAEHVMDRIKPGRPLPPDAEIAELLTSWSGSAPKPWRPSPPPSHPRSNPISSRSRAAYSPTTWKTHRSRA